MEKKSLGRSLEEISSVFLSTNEEPKEEKNTYGFATVTLSEDSCASCTNLLEVPFGQPECRIFSLESEEGGAPSMDSIGLSFAEPCEYFRPVALEEKNTRDARNAGYPYQPENRCEVEETVKVRRTIAFEEDESGQQNIRGALSRHLKEGYRIKRIELKKIEDNSGPRNRVRTEEDVTIFIKSSLSP